MNATSANQPSSSLVANLRTELMRYAPFAQMQASHVDHFVTAAEQANYAPGETLLYALLVRQYRASRSAAFQSLARCHRMTDA